MKRDAYPEDSTQSAYSSQLIWIPLSHHFFFFIFEALFLERQPKDNAGAVIRISYWGRRLQMCAHTSAFHISDWRSCLHQIWQQHSSFRWFKLSVLSLSLLSHFCLGRRRSDWKSQLSIQARQPSRHNRLRARLTFYFRGWWDADAITIRFPNLSTLYLIGSS